MQSIIDSGINGILVLPGDALALGKAIGDLYFDKITDVEICLHNYDT